MDLGLSIGWQGYVGILFEVHLGTDAWLVSSPGRDSRDIRSSHLAKATEKALGTNALCTGSVVAAPVLREGDQSKETRSFGYQTERPLQ